MEKTRLRQLSHVSINYNLCNLVQTIKLHKPIKPSMKRFLERTCHLNPDKRFRLNEVMLDPYYQNIVQAKLKGDIVVKFDNKWICDFKVENIAEGIITKSEKILEYFNNIFGCEDSSGFIPIHHHNQCLNEISVFLFLTHLETQLCGEFLQNKFMTDSELHLVRINSNSFDYSFSKFIEDKISINRENMKLDEYLKKLSLVKDSIYKLLKKVLLLRDIDIDKMENYDYMKSNCSATTEKYFFALFERGIENFRSREFNSALNDLIISKYYYENLIFMRVILKELQKTADFDEVIENLELEDSINIIKDPSIFNESCSSSLVIFSFLGSIYRNLVLTKEMEEDSKNRSNLGKSVDLLSSVISFYPDIVRLIQECQNLKNV